MRRMCARCGAVFRGRWALHLMWCKVDRFHVCRRCWEWECEEGHGKGREEVGIPTWEAASMTLFFWWFLGPPGVAAVTLGTPLGLLAGIAIQLPFVAAVVWVVRENGRRRRRHASASRSIPPVEVRDDGTGPDPAMPWRENAGWGFPEKIRAAAIVAAISGTLTAIGVAVVLPVLSAGERIPFALLAGFLVAFTVQAPVWAVIEAGPRPTLMALTDRGVHFWYPAPEERRLADGYVEWREIEFIGMRRAGKSQWRALERTNGVSDTLDFLSPKNWKALVEEWGRRAPPAPV